MLVGVRVEVGGWKVEGGTEPKPILEGVRITEEIGWLTSALESAPSPILTSRPAPAREIPAVMPPFFGLLGLK